MLRNLSAILSLAMALGGCNGAPGEAGRPGAEAVPEPGGMVVIGVTDEPHSLLDVTATTSIAHDVIDQLFLALVDIREDLISFDPELARSWEEGEDGKSVTFHLAPEALWHDGAPVTARDVVFTHELHVDPVVGYAARSWKRFITGVTAEDDHTVTFRFDRKYPYQIMDAAVGVILPAHLLENVPRAELSSCAFAREPVGAGPFRLASWDAKRALVLEADREFFLGRPHLDRVVFRIVPDKTSLLVQLESGEIDVMQDVPPQDVSRLRDKGALRVEAFPSRSYTYIGWDATNPLFASKDVRRALTLAIDRQGIIDALCYGFAQPCRGPVHPILWAHKEDLPLTPYDPDSARAVLAGAGWRDTDGDGWLDRDGQRFEFELKTNHGNQVREDASVIIQDQLARVGVKVATGTYEWNVLWDSVVRHTYETAVLVGWNVGLKVDLTPTFHSRSLKEKYNHTGYSSPEVDELIDRAVAAETLEAAEPLWHEVQERIVADQPYTFLLIQDRIFGVNERVRGTVPDTRGYYRNLRDWWIPASARRQRTGA